MHYRLITLIAAAALATVGCHTTKSQDPVPQPAPVGEFRGLVSVDGTDRPASLSVVPADDGLRAVLHVAGEALAFGQAEWLQGTLYVGLDYANAADPRCPGRMHLVTDPTSVGITLTGDLHARDCTGSAMGSFTFGLHSAIP